ncbi:MAG: hypothetical protein KF744_02715 [Taibaiella sp.]|nr:hypothetical protein [Taibaiella sp.]
MARHTGTWIGNYLAIRTGIPVRTYTFTAIAGSAVKAGNAGTWIFFTCGVKYCAKCAEGK